MKNQRKSVFVVFYVLILTNGSIQAADYNCSVPNLPSANENRPARTGSDFTPVKKSFSELPTTINGTTWPQRSSFESQVSAMDESQIIDISSDISTNTIWQRTNVYHVTADIQVQALLVIEPGTTITFAENARIRVNNGGCLSACGSPDKIIRFVPDTTIEQYVGAFSAIYIDATASPATQVRYCLFKQAHTGIFTSNMRLDTAIHNNYFNSCVYGVAEQGIQLTDVFNNQFYMSYQVAIYVDVLSSDEQDSSTSEILIQNNTCNYVQYYAIAILGANTEADKGRIKIVNNILSNAYYGIYWAYYAWLYPANNGYYNNYANRNFTYEESGCVEITTGAETPFETGTGDFDRCYLKQTCPFIDAGCIGINMDEETVGSFSVKNGDVSQIPQILGFTTAVNDDCDLSLVDLGFHSPNFDKVNVGEYYLFLISDLNQDGTVDNSDLTILRNHYGQSGTSADGDINGDGIIDAHDLRILRKQWGLTGYSYPDIQPNVPTGSLSGDVNVGIIGNASDLTALYLFLDGEFIEAFPIDREDKNISLESYRYINTLHNMKLIGVTKFGGVGLFNNTSISFENTLHCLSYSHTYNRNKNFFLAGIYDGTNTASVKVCDFKNTEVFNSQLNNSPLGISTATLDKHCYEIIISDPSGTTIFDQQIFEEFDPSKVLDDIQMLITYCPDSWGTLNNSRNRFYAVLDAADAKFGSNPFNVFVLFRPNWEQLSKILSLPNLHYWYHFGHCDYQIQDEGGNYAIRTYIKIASDNDKYWNCTENIFSLSAQDIQYLPEGYQPSSYQSLPPEYEHSAHTIGSLKLGKSNKLKLVFMDGCYSGRVLMPCNRNLYPNDMALALGMYSDEISPTQVYLGWYNQTHATVFNWMSDDQMWFMRLWSCSPYHGLGSPNSLKQALIYSDQFKARNNLAGNLQIYGNAYEDFQTYDQLELIYLQSD